MLSQYVIEKDINKLELYIASLRRRAEGLLTSSAPLPEFDMTVTSGGVIAKGNGVTCAVVICKDLDTRDSGEVWIVASKDELTWNYVYNLGTLDNMGMTGVDGQMSKLAFLNGCFYVMTSIIDNAEKKGVYYSYDGYHWEFLEVPVMSRGIYELHYVNGTWLYCDYNTKLMESLDLVTWRPITIFTDSRLNPVFTSNAAIVMSRNGVVYTSKDGHIFGKRFYVGCYQNINVIDDMCYIIVGKVVYGSRDGLDWQPCNWTLREDYEYANFDVTFRFRGYYYTMSTYSYRSLDGYNWEKLESAPKDLNYCASANDDFIIAGGFMGLYKSTDGETFALVSSSLKRVRPLVNTGIGYLVIGDYVYFSETGDSWRPVLLEYISVYNGRNDCDVLSIENGVIVITPLGALTTNDQGQTWSWLPKPEEKVTGDP